VLQILEHDFSDTVNKRWLVQWYSENLPSRTGRPCNTQRRRSISSILRYTYSSRHQNQARRNEHYALPQEPQLHIIDLRSRKRSEEDRKRNNPRHKVRMWTLKTTHERILGKETTYMKGLINLRRFLTKTRNKGILRQALKTRSNDVVKMH